jgi:hypothetical protein
MDSEMFDATARTFAAALTRRSAVRGLVAGAVAAIGGGVLVRDEVDARKKRNKPGSDRCLTSGKRCTSDSQCCSKAGLICEVPTGGSNSDTFCCGGQGSVCGGANEDGDAVGPVCCVNFRCSTGDIDAADFVPFQRGACIRDADEV